MQSGLTLVNTPGIFLRSWSFLLWNGSPNISLFCPEALVQQTAGNAGR